MVDIEKAREWLRVSTTDTDDHIMGLLSAVPDYIYTASGVTADQQENEPLAEIITMFLLMMWYDAASTETERYLRTVDNLLKTLTAKVRGNNKTED